jgi:ABC-type dipeptide/oligopeptide/nickel transport systems, permease components
VGLAGVAFTFILGSVLGAISGYYGGTVDFIIQRVIEFILCIPAIPLWMALSAALPRDWSPTRVYFAISIILSLIGWCSLARVVRARCWRCGSRSSSPPRGWPAPPTPG